MNRADHHSATFPTERSGAVQLSRNRASCQSRRSNTASRAACTRVNACRSRACLHRRHARGHHSGRVRHQTWLKCCLFIQTWIPPNTRPAPALVPDRQIRGFLFVFPHPAACLKFDQYAPKTSRKGVTIPAGAPRPASGSRCHSFSDCQSRYTA